MPDWMQEIIHNDPRLVALGLITGTYTGCYNIFAWVEDSLSVSAKQGITAWLKSTGDFAANQALSFNLSRFHSKLFGDKQLSVKCVARTTLFSLISFLLVYLPDIISYSIYIPHMSIGNDAVKIHDAYTVVEELFFVSFILLVLPLDFCGVAVTRKLVSLAGNNVTLRKVALIFLFDTFIKTVIFHACHLYLYFYL
jgi:hypothetical protein